MSRKYFAPHDNAGAGEPIRLAGLVRDRWRRHPATEQPADKAKIDTCFKLSQWRRKPKRRPLWSTVRIFQAAPRNSNVQMLIHEIGQRLKCIRADDGIRIKEQNILRRFSRLQGRPKNDIITARESLIGAEHCQAAPGIPTLLRNCFLNSLCGIIAGAIFANSDMTPRQVWDFI